MITVAAKLKVQKGTEAKLEEALRDMIGYVRDQEPGTLKYVLHQGQSDPTEFFLFEQYTDQTAFDTHAKSEKFLSLFGVLGPILDGQPSIEFYREVAGKW